MTALVRAVLARLRPHVPTPRERQALYLVVLILALGGGNLLWTSHAVNVAKSDSAQVARNAARQAQQASDRAAREAVQAAVANSNQSWCDSLVLLTSVKPKANQPGSLRLWTNFVKLEHKFGCDHR